MAYAVFQPPSDCVTGSLRALLPAEMAHMDSSGFIYPWPPALLRAAFIYQSIIILLFSPRRLVIKTRSALLKV